MGKAFVAKLAKEGARDPEALAAWIGRKKHGKAAFAKLAAKGRKSDDKPSTPRRAATPATPARAAQKAATRARKASAAAAEHDASKPTIRNGRPGTIGPGSPEFDAKKSAQLHRKAQQEREKAAAAYEAVGDAQMARSMRESAEMHRIGALHADKIADGTGSYDNQSGLAQVSSNVKTFDRMDEDRQQRAATRAAAGSEKPAEAPEVRASRARVAAAEKRATEARQQADRANESASAAYGRFAGGQKILTGHYTERSALRDRARADSRTRRAIAATEAAERAESQARTAQAEAQGAEMRAARSRPWVRGDFQAGDTVTMDRAGRPGESYRVVRANAKSVTVSRGHAGMDNKTIPYDKILSRSRDGETTSDPGMSPPAAERPALPTPAEQRAAAMTRMNEASARRAEEARQEAAERRQRTLETLARINAAPGKPTRKAMTPEERRLVNYEANGAALSVDNYERLRPFADESAQTNRVDVLKSRAFHKARQERIKNGWAVPGEDTPTPAAPTVSRRRDPVAEARERTAEQQRETAARARLAEAAAARASVRDNRPADVDASLERVDALLTRYRSGLSSGSITRTSDQRLTGFADLLRKLQQRDPAEFNRAEARAIVDFGRLVRSEAARRGLPI